jgi:hypothetical protein
VSLEKSIRAKQGQINNQKSTIVNRQSEATVKKSGDRKI